MNNSRDILQQNQIELSEFYVDVRDFVLTQGVRHKNKIFTSHLLKVRENGVNLEIEYIENHVIAVQTLTILKHYGGNYKHVLTIRCKGETQSITYQQAFSPQFFESIIYWYTENLWL